MRTILSALLVCISLVISAQERPFWSEIKSFAAQDSVRLPPRNAIVFVGSSSFKMWKDVGKAFPDHEVINRGFGGSSLPHVIEYADEIIIPYNPKQVVVYSGENDFMSDTVTNEVVVDRFKQLYNLLRKDIPQTEILFVSMKPSPSRQHLFSKISVANDAIKNFLSKQRNAAFIDVWKPMLDKNGAPRKELFLTDMLHMNEKGYVIWQKAIEPHLK